MSKIVEQNTLKRRGVGLRAFDPERACPGFTLFAPVFEQNRTVYLIDLQGEVVHTWQLPHAPGPLIATTTAAIQAAIAEERQQLTWVL
jgi:hypothetical protein